MSLPDDTLAGIVPSEEDFAAARDADASVPVPLEVARMLGPVVMQVTSDAQYATTEAIAQEAERLQVVMSGRAFAAWVRGLSWQLRCGV